MSDREPNDASRKPKNFDFAPCPESVRLQNALHAIQQQLDELIAEQHAAFRANDEAKFWRLNKELEPMKEQREHSLEALRRHIRTHHCQPAFDPLA